MPCPARIIATMPTSLTSASQNSSSPKTPMARFSPPMNSTMDSTQIQRGVGKPEPHVDLPNAGEHRRGGDVIISESGWVQPVTNRARGGPRWLLAYGRISRTPARYPISSARASPCTPPRRRPGRPAAPAGPAYLDGRCRNRKNRPETDQTSHETNMTGVQPKPKPRRASSSASYCCLFLLCLGRAAGRVSATAGPAGAFR